MRSSLQIPHPRLWALPLPGIVRCPIRLAGADAELTGLLNTFRTSGSIGSVDGVQLSPGHRAVARQGPSTTRPDWSRTTLSAAARIRSSWVATRIAVPAD